MDRAAVDGLEGLADRLGRDDHRAARLGCRALRTHLDAEVERLRNQDDHDLDPEVIRGMASRMPRVTEVVLQADSIPRGVPEALAAFHCLTRLELCCDGPPDFWALRLPQLRELSLGPSTSAWTLESGHLDGLPGLRGLTTGAFIDVNLGWPAPAGLTRVCASSVARGGLVGAPGLLELDLTRGPPRFVPEDLPGLTALTRLTLSWPGEIETLPPLPAGLSTLWLRRNLGCLDPSAVAALRGLTDLGLNGIGGGLGPLAPVLPRLRALRINDYRLEDLAPLEAATALTRLDLWGCHKAQGVTRLTVLTGLRELMLMCDGREELASALGMRGVRCMAGETALFRA